MMDRTLLALLIGMLCAFVFGFFIARRSNVEDAVQGGQWAQVFHFIGAAGIGGIVPVVLVSLILGLGFKTAFPLAFSFLLVAGAALLIYALFEYRVRKEVIRASHSITETSEQ